MSEKKSYSIKELSAILGCSLTAVQKKITVDENNPDIKRYKKRYEVVIKDGKSLILLSDSELEEEKRLSKGFNNVSKTYNETSENVIDVEAEPRAQANQEFIIDKILDFTNVHIERYETLHKTYYNDLMQKDKQIYLLTTSENKKEAEYLQSQAKQKELEKKNRVLKCYIIVLITLLITLCAGFITFYFFNNNVSTPSILSDYINAEIEQ